MEPVCNDAVFGEMKYKHRWYKTERFSFFNKEWDVIVAAKAFSEKPINDKQRDGYKWFKENFLELADKTANAIIEYINSNCEDLAQTWAGARRVNSSKDLNQIVTPKSLLIKQDGTILLLFECVWDKEHGLAVQVAPEFAIGSQDAFL